MKTLTKLALSAALMAPLSVSLHAQTLLSDFSTGSGWGASQSLVGGNSSISINSGAANYTVSVSGDSEFSFLGNTGYVASYTSNWTLRINVAYASPGSIYGGETVAQAINAGFMVVKTGVTPGVGGGGPDFNAFLLNANLYSNGAGTYSRDIRSSVFVANEEPADGETRYYQGGASGAWTSTLKIAFDATTKVLSGAFDGAGGTSFTFMNTLSADSVDASTWGMTGADTFTVYLMGNSLYDGGASGVGPDLGMGEVTLDNLYATGGVSAVPEPSTYAVILGAAVLGLAAWRRRQAAQVIAS